MFGRKRAGLPATERTAVALAPVLTVPAPGQAGGLVRGWRGMGVIPASDQVGAYTGTAVTMRGGNVAEVQRRQGVEGLSASWYVPPQLATPTGALNNMVNAGLIGNQRLTGGTSGGVGPITARKMRANVTAAQVRQSGLSAVQWAQSLSPQ